MHAKQFVKSQTAGETRLIEANPLEETLNQLAVKRGPLVYCLESVDLPEGVRVGDVRLSPNIKMTMQLDPQLLGGIVALTGNAETRKAGDWKGILYREAQASRTTP